MNIPSASSELTVEGCPHPQASASFSQGPCLFISESLACGTGHGPQKPQECLLTGWIGGGMEWGWWKGKMDDEKVRGRMGGE